MTLRWLLPDHLRPSKDSVTSTREQKVVIVQMIHRNPQNCTRPKGQSCPTHLWNCSTRQSVPLLSVGSLAFHCRRSPSNRNGGGINDRSSWISSQTKSSNAFHRLAGLVSNPARWISRPDPSLDGGRLKMIDTLARIAEKVTSLPTTQSLTRAVFEGSERSPDGVSALSLG
jgi:hypothetical protein